MSNPIPQRLPQSLISSDRGRYIQELINAATLLRNGATGLEIRQKAPDAFLQELSKVLDQINKGEAANPLNYQIPYQGDEALFFKEFLDAIEQLR